MGIEPIGNETGHARVWRQLRSWIEYDRLCIACPHQGPASLYQGALGERTHRRRDRANLTQHQCRRQVRTQSFDRRQPAMTSIEQFVEVLLVETVPDVSDCRRITRAHSGVSRLGAARDCGLESRPRTFPDQSAFELGKGAEHLGHQHALRARSIDRVIDRPEIGTLRPERFDDLEQMRQRARQAIYPDHQQGIPLPHPVQRASEVWTLLAGTAGYPRR